MSDMVKILVGSINVAARFGGRCYIGTGLPMCDCEGIEWEDMSPKDRWDMCVAHLRRQDVDFDELLRKLNEYGDEQIAIDLILFAQDRAMRLFDATRDEGVAEVMELVHVQAGCDMDAATKALLKQGDDLWDTLFEYEIIITKSLRKN